MASTPPDENPDPIPTPDDPPAVPAQHPDEPPPPGTDPWHEGP